MKTNRFIILTIQSLIIIGFNYFMWTDTNLPNQKNIGPSLLFLIGLFHLGMFGLIFYTLEQKTISKQKCSLILDLSFLMVSITLFYGGLQNCLIGANNFKMNYVFIILGAFTTAFLVFETFTSYMKVKTEILTS